ncbi:MAG: glycosyltransferase [Pyrinomonadaceae bacterium]
MAAHKGQTDFVRAAAIVLKRFPEAEFLIAGRDASPQRKYENDLRSLIEELGLQNKIHLLGWIRRRCAVFRRARRFRFGFASSSRSAW